jgi:hypothetical protein
LFFRHEASIKKDDATAGAGEVGNGPEQTVQKNASVAVRGKLGRNFAPHGLVDAGGQIACLRVWARNHRHNNIIVLMIGQGLRYRGSAAGHYPRYIKYLVKPLAAKRRSDQRISSRRRHKALAFAEMLS